MELIKFLSYPNSLIPIYMQQILAIIIFLITFVFITTERIHRTIIALLCATLMMLMLVIGGGHQESLLSIETIAHFIDWETIALLTGMMIIVNIAVETGIFSFFAIKAAKLSKGNPIGLLISFSIITAVGSAFLDNVTTVLLVVPITLSVTKILKLNPVPFFFSEIFFSNIGGAATQIGDPPNIMIGSQNPHLSFMDFIANLSPAAIIAGIITLGIVLLIYRKDLLMDNTEIENLMHIDANKYISDHAQAKKSLIVLIVVLFFFFTHSIFHISGGAVAMIGATVLLLLTKNNESKLEHVFGKVEWTTLFLLIGLFIQVKGLEIAGIIDVIANTLFKLVGTNEIAASSVTIWFSSLFSGFSGNLPSATVMIPVLQKYIEVTSIVNGDVLWWSLSLGACLGGIATLLGCPANIVVVNMAQKEGYKITYFDYLKFGLPIAVLSVFAGQIYILLRYFVFK